MADSDVNEVPVRSMTDPSTLATAALQREVAAIKEQFRIEQQGSYGIIHARLDAIDKATQVFEANLTRVPTELQKEITHLRDYHGEKFQKIENHMAGMQRLKDEQFRAIQQQFLERDARYEAQAVASDKAIAAALQAAKEAVSEQNHSAALAIGKSESAQAKALDQLISQMKTQEAATFGQIADIKDRLARIEAIAIGQASQKQETNTSSGFTVSLVGIGLAILSALMAGFAFIRGIQIGK